jgi:hypothetical protein
MKIHVNGREKFLVGAPLLSFDAVVQLCRGEVTRPESYTVTFRAKKSKTESVEGILSPGESVQALEGMVFNAHITNNA